MTRFIAKSIAIISIICMLLTVITADERTENIDCFILLDKSLSMEGLIDDVASYINDEIVSKILIEGDYIKVIQFYGKAEPLLLEHIEREQTRENIRRAVVSVRADGFYTDIGNALDTLKRTLEDHDSGERRRYLLLVTDGIQEAPPESIYYSPGGPDPQFNHAFMENSKIIRKQGWKIHILGIGMDSGAQEVADVLSGTFSQVNADSDADTENLSSEELRESTKEFLGTIRLEGRPELKILNMKGKGTLSLFLASDGYPNVRDVKVREVRLNVQSGSFRIADGAEISIAPESTGILAMDIAVPAGLEDTSGELVFEFENNLVFTPSIVDVSITHPGFLIRYGMLILLVIAGLVLLALLVFLVTQMIKKRPGKVELAINIGEGKEQILSITEGTMLFLSEGLGGIHVTLRKTGEVLGNLTCRINQLVLEPVLKDRFAGARISGNILEKTIRIKDRFGSFIPVRISKK